MGDPGPPERLLGGFKQNKKRAFIVYLKHSLPGREWLDQPEHMICKQEGPLQPEHLWSELRAEPSRLQPQTKSSFPELGTFLQPVAAFQTGKMHLENFSLGCPSSTPTCWGLGRLFYFFLSHKQINVFNVSVPPLCAGSCRKRCAKDGDSCVYSSKNLLGPGVV